MTDMSISLLSTSVVQASSSTTRETERLRKSGMPQELINWASQKEWLQPTTTMTALSTSM